jgi:hypothetical protein
VALHCSANGGSAGGVVGDVERCNVAGDCSCPSRSCSAAASRAFRITCAPALASDCAIAQPRPREAPLTSATFPDKENISPPVVGFPGDDKASTAEVLPSYARDRGHARCRCSSATREMRDACEGPV